MAGETTIAAYAWAQGYQHLLNQVEHYQQQHNQPRQTYTMNNPYTKENMHIKLAPGATAPKQATPGSAGYDLHAHIEDNIPFAITHKKTQTIHTGVSVAIPEGYVGLITPRSSLGKRGLALANTVGVIDSDYRGEILLVVTNHSEKPVNVRQGDRIAQLLLVPVFNPALEVVDELPGTVRGLGGFGSTGR